MDLTQNHHFPRPAPDYGARHDDAGSDIGRGRASAGGQRGLARRDDRDGQARAADRAHAARPDRHDDERSRADRPARRQGGRGRRARAHRAVHRCSCSAWGIVSAVAPLAAQYYGARQPRMVRRALRVGLWASVILGAPLTLAQLWGGELLLALGQSARAPALADRYLARHGLVPDPGLVLHGAAQLHGRGEPSGARALDHARGDPGQCFARLRADLRGVRPAGASTCSAPGSRPRSSTSACASRRSGSATRGVRYRKYRVLGRWWRADWALMKQLIVVGAPMSGSFLLEYGVFAAAAQLMGWIGTAALAAHQIALQIAAVMFMVPFGIAMAATVRVGQAAGRGDAAATRRAGFVGDRARRRVHGGDDAAGRAHAPHAAAAVPRQSRRRIRRPSRSPPRCWCSARASSSPTACRPSRPARCAG